MYNETKEARQVPQTPMPPIRALLLDDSSFDRTRIRRLSQQTDLPIEIDEVDSISQMQTAIKNESYNLFMIDYRLPVGDGLAAMSALRDDPRSREAGIIMITGNAQLDTAVSAMRSGYDDVLSKSDIDAEKLKSAVVSAMLSSQAKQMKAKQEGLSADQIQDSILQAMNDPSMQDRLATMLADQVAQSQSASFRPDMDVGLLDVFTDDDEFDFFKQSLN